MPRLMTNENPSSLRCFLALPFSQEYDQVRKAIIDGAREANYQVFSLDQEPVLPGSTIQEAIIGEIARADCIIADVTDSNPNVFFELGLAKAMGKGLLLMAQERSLHDVPFDLREFRVITYDIHPKSLLELSLKIGRSLIEFQRLPRSAPIVSDSQFSLPFFIDWDRLGARESENLCRELLAQMGFLRLEWGKISPEIDLVAELPRKDPDGFEYREFWLISMGLNAPIEASLHMFGKDPEYFLHRILRYSDRLEERFSRSADTSVTLLLILFKEKQEPEELEMLRERMEKRRYRKEPFGFSLRLRIWDQTYLTSLVHRFPQIGYKYFSDEGRIRSKTRKSYEELYKENSNLVSRQAKLISELEEEKNRRIRAERDSVWRDISFSAAHKIGNPIFAIETDLDPLVKRIRETRTSEAEEVIVNIRSSVEKAKAFVEQFKSLAKAQEIKPVETPLLPIFQDACQLVKNQEVVCNIDCHADITVHADPERLAECFDELVINAAHWLDKSEKIIEIVVIHPAPSPLPRFLDSSQGYVLIHIKDTGCGVPVTDKERIFDAFFTTYDHGTGLGLALIRRIIDGHGGGVIESGIPGEGADFEIYLPSSKSNVKNKE